MLWILLLTISCPFFASEPSLKPKPWNFQTLQVLPVQSAGRIKPFETYAQELVKTITAQNSFEKFNPIDLLFSWIAYPQQWNEKPLFYLTKDIQNFLELSSDPQHPNLFSHTELLQNETLIEVSHKITLPEAALSPIEKTIKTLIGRIQLFQGVISGRAWPIVPTETEWLNLSNTQETGKSIIYEFWMLLKQYQTNNPIGFENNAHRLMGAIQFLIPAFDQVKHRILAEVLLNHLNPFLWSWIFYFLACCFFTWQHFFLNKRRIIKKSAFFFIGLGIFFHITGISLRCYIAQRPPVTNMYESVIWVSLGCIVIGLAMGWFQKNTLITWIASGLAGVFLICADYSTQILEPAIHPLVPVLRSNFWLTIHVLTITLSYAAFALSFGISSFFLWNHSKNCSFRVLKNLNDLTYRSIQIGVILIAAGTILGGIWADYSWGRFWGWDPKEVWALITLLVYAAILHGRYTSWMTPFRFALSANLCFLSVLMAWLGVNFILGTGLHSYGFSSGGGAFISGFTLIHLSFLGFIWLKSNKYHLPILRKPHP